VLSTTRRTEMSHIVLWIANGGERAGTAEPATSSGSDMVEKGVGSVRVVGWAVKKSLSGFVRRLKELPLKRKSLLRVR
jgi:hypothetical protein